MRKQDIEIVINAKGEVTYEIKGVKGPSCVAETAFLKDALGGDAAVADDGKTAEFYEQAEGYGQAYVGGANGGADKEDQDG